MLQLPKCITVNYRTDKAASGKKPKKNDERILNTLSFFFFVEVMFFIIQCFIFIWTIWLIDDGCQWEFDVPICGWTSWEYTLWSTYGLLGRLYMLIYNLKKYYIIYNVAAQKKLNKSHRVLHNYTSLEFFSH